MKIYGAGISGLLAGATFQTAEIFDSSPPNTGLHKAVLRFRTPAVGEAVGIDFRKVTVHKGLWMDGAYVQPNIRLANFYSMKVVGRLADRSVWKLETAERFVAPEDFVAQLIDRCAGRIHWNHPITREDVLTNEEPAISTLPLNVMAKFLDEPCPAFDFSPIKVKRWRVPNADVFQTVYFPDPMVSVYRVSMTGDMLIAEYADDLNTGDDSPIFEAFGVSRQDVVPLEKSKQSYGKIVPVNDAWRKDFIFRLTHQHGVFSLGRFGTWRNIMLDDVLHDLAVIKRLANAGRYEAAKINAK